MGQAKQRGTYDERVAQSSSGARVVDPTPRIDRERAVLILRARRYRDFPESITLINKSRQFTVNWSLKTQIKARQADVADALIRLGWSYKKLPGEGGAA
jgi:hypothetical protein